MSRSRHNGCGKTCGVCRPHKKVKRKGAKNAQYDKPAVRKRVEKGKEEKGDT